MFEESRSNDGDPVELYCIRKYVSEKPLRNYTVNMNPKNVNGFDTDCKLIIKNAKQDAATVIASDKGLNATQRKCVKEKFLEKAEYFDALAVAIYLGQAKGLLMEQIEEERSLFIAAMNRMTEHCNQCVLKKEKT